MMHTIAPAVVARRHAATHSFGIRQNGRAHTVR